jgi:predicted transcriptional regulator
MIARSEAEGSAVVRKTRAKRPEKPLTATELEMMNVIWRLGPCSVHQVVEALRPNRELAYTSVSTIVRILEQKGYVTSLKAGRGHVYEAAIDKETYQAKSLERLVSNVFDGTPTLLVQRLLDSNQLSIEELERLRKMVRAREP